MPQLQQCYLLPAASRYHPPMNYVNLNNAVVKAQQPALVYDLNMAGRIDIAFNVMLLSDPIQQQNKWQFMAVTDIYTALLVDTNETTPVADRATIIIREGFAGYQWYGASNVVWIQKVVSMAIPDYWESNWLNVNKKYLPFQIMKDNKKYDGWIELTEDHANEQIISHRFAISKQADTAVVAGI